MSLGRAMWRVGYHADPAGFVPREIYAFNHRFDDAAQRFRTLYCAKLPETCVREVLADFRPNLAAQRRHVERYGPQATADFVSQPVTARWRQEHVLALIALDLDGPLIDLTDVATRQALEEEHGDLLLEHDLPHLDLHEITTQRRRVTQKLAGHLYDDGAAAVRFPSRLDGNPCIAVFEGRAAAVLAAEPTPLTDPPPEPLAKVAAVWRLDLEPAAAVAVSDWRTSVGYRPGSPRG